MQLTLDSARTAVVLIDFQGGTLAMPLTPTDGPALIRRGVELARTAKSKGALLCLVNVGFSADLKDLPGRNVDTPIAVPAGGLPAGWDRLAPEISSLPADLRITKRQWSAFHGTELDLQLRRRGITTIILCGIATNFGVESTARDGWQLGYDMVIASDACSSISDEAHRFALEKTLPRVSRVRTSAQVMTALNG